MPNVTVNLSGDEARLLASLDRVVQKERQLATAAGDTGKKSREANEVSARTMQRVNEHQERTISQFGRMAAGLGAVATAAGIARQAIEMMNKANDEAASKQRGAEKGLSSLAQLSGGSPRRLRELTGAARSIYAGGGAANMDEAARLVFSLESAGMLKERALFGSLYGIVDSPATMARSAATLQSAMGAGETGGARAILSKAMAASKYSPASAEALLEAASTGGGYMRSLGGSDEELLSANAIMATATGSAGEGGTTVASLLAALTKKGGYQGMSLRGMIEKIQSKGMSDKALVKYFGRKEAFRAYDVLSRNLPQLEEISGAQREAQQSDLIGSIIESARLDPTLAAAREQRVGAAQLELARGRRGIERNRSEAVIDKVLSEHEAAGGSQFGGALKEWNMRSQRWLFGDDQTVFTYGNETERKQYIGAGNASAQNALDAKVNKPAGIKIDVQFERDPRAGTE